MVPQNCLSKHAESVVTEGLQTGQGTEEGRPGLTPSGSGVGVSNTLAHTIYYKLYKHDVTTAVRTFHRDRRGRSRAKFGRPRIISLFPWGRPGIDTP